MHVQDKNKLATDRISRSYTRGRLAGKSQKFRTALKNYVILERELSNICYKDFFSTLDIKLNVPIQTGLGCVLVHPSQPNGCPTLTSVLLLVESIPVLTIDT